MKRRHAVLDVSDLRVVSRDVKILDGVTWRVAPRENWVILGANGSGKTSLLAALTGYLPPTSGELEVLGERYGCSDWRELRKRVGLVSAAIHPFMIAGDEPALRTVASGKLAMLGFYGELPAADEARARRIMKLIECEHLEDRPWRVLSQGERQRVLIGRALMGDPPLLILDEPCAGLDPAAREHFLQFLVRLARGKRGPSLVLVTHHVEEIVPAFSHVLVLKGGRVLGAGTRKGMLTSRQLSLAFGTKVLLSARAGRYQLRVPARARKVM